MFPKILNQESVEQMKSFGNFLMPFNFPLVSETDEEEIGILKSLDFTVDGYSVFIYYSKADWGEHFLETIKITGRYAPFLPFSLICKIGRKILGDEFLSYLDFFQNGRKFYCWTRLLDRENKPTFGHYNVESLNCSYDGFTYRLLKGHQTNLP